MLIVLERDCSAESIQSIFDKLEGMGLSGLLAECDTRQVIALTGNRSPIDPSAFEALPGVADLITISRPYPLADKEKSPGRTVVRVGGVAIGDGAIVIAAGPCAVETEALTIATAQAVREAGAHLLRGGAFKPRSSPYSFQGLGLEGLKILAKARRETGLPIVTEALDVESVGLIEEYADMIQIGARNMHNYPLLKRAGRSHRPVFLKRGLAATLEELILSAEYVLAEGNGQIVLCERGVRTFAQHARNTLDLAIVPAAHARTHLPIFVDPSHGTGRSDKVAPMARAAVAAGADGLMIEVHPEPERALCDGVQALRPAAFAELMKDLTRIAPIVGRTLDIPARIDGSTARA